MTGATPVFVDVEEATFNIDADSLKRGIATARKLGLKPRAVIPVDLFGQSADHDAIGAVAEAEGLFVLDDAAQGFGASYKGRRLGTFGLVTATSFFPAKPLGCFGDGGAIFTDDARSSPRRCAASACTARAPTNTTMSGSASPRGSTPCRRRSCSRN